MKMRNLQLIILVQLGLVACGSESPTNVAEIDFDDSYVENCVFQKQWQLNEGSMSHVTTLKTAAGDTYSNDSAVPMAAITEVKDCTTYNSDASFSASQPYELPEAAQHLRDLDKLSFLRKVSLDFPVQDYSALSSLDKITTLTLDESSGTIDSYSLPLYLIADMAELTKLSIVGDMYEDYSNLRVSENVQYLNIEYSTPKATSLDAGDLPLNLKSLSLTNTWLSDASEYKLLSSLTELKLAPGSDAAIEPDFAIFKDFENLTSLTLRLTNFSDLSVLELPNLESLTLELGTEQFESFNWQYLSNFSNLKQISITGPEAFGSGSADGDTPAPFKTRYQSLEAYNNGTLEADEYGVFDRVYAVVSLTQEQTDTVGQSFDLTYVSSSQDSDLYVIDFLTPEKVVDLYSLWLQGEISEFK